MPYIVFSPTREGEASGEIQTLWRTLEEALQYLAENPTFMISPELTIDEIKDAQPGQHFSGSNVIAPEMPLIDTEKLRQSARTMYHRLIDLSVKLNSEGYAEPHIETAKAHNFVYQAHIAAFIICNDATLTADQRIEWALLHGQGPTDVTSPAEFYSKISGFPAPTHPITWANPRTSVRTTLSEGILLSSTPPPKGLGLGNIDISEDIHIGSGEWISRLIA